MSSSARQTVTHKNEDDSYVNDTWQTIDCRYKKYWSDERKNMVSQRIMPIITAFKHLWGTHDGSISRELSKEYTPQVELRSKRDLTRSNTRGDNNVQNRVSLAATPIDNQNGIGRAGSAKKGISSFKAAHSTFSMKAAEVSTSHNLTLKTNQTIFKEIHRQKTLRSKVFADFDIDEEKLNSLSTNEEKRSLVVKSIFDRISNDLKSIVEEHEKRTAIDKEEDEAAKKNLDNGESRDIFEWLHLPTSNINLRRLLRTKLIQLFTSVAVGYLGRKL